MDAFWRLFMAERLAENFLHYSGYFLEVALLTVVLWRGYLKRLTAPVCYVASFLAAGVFRSLILYRYGLSSRQYFYTYFLSDFLLVVAAFLVVCAFFRRACVREQKLWHFVRLFLIFTFVIVVGISALSLSRNYSHLFSTFIVEFEQNVYFTCLVLNTLLYILMQQVQSADDELSLLVCGIGIQYAGPSASFALLHLTLGQHFSASLYRFIVPVCNNAMLLTWLYAVARMPKLAQALARKGAGRPARELAESEAAVLVSQA